MISFLGKNLLETKTLMKWSFYLIRLKNIHETVTCDDRDPPWINKNIKQLIQEENNTYRSYILNDKNPQIFHKVKYLQKQLKKLMEHSQEKYYMRILKKMMDPMTSLKTYRSLIKTLLNNKKNSLYSSFTSRQQTCSRFQKESRII